MSEEQAKKQFKVKVPESEEEGVYANAVSVHINNNECVIDFAYSLPNTKEPSVKITSRVNMSHRTAESLLKVLSNAVLDWKNRNEEQDGK